MKNLVEEHFLKLIQIESIIQIEWSKAIRLKLQSNKQQHKVFSVK